MARVSGKLDAEENLKRLGKVILAYRKAKNLSQEALADAAGIDRTHMGRIERGERNLTLLNIIRVAAAVEMAPSELLAAAGL
jgi:transcriptional regulator with XRE-family HTH domain